MTLYFITGNQGKLKEAQRFIPRIEGRNSELSEIQSLSLEEVVIHKALSLVNQYTGCPFIVEDSSLQLEGMNGLPGTFIKWFERTIKLEGIADLARKQDNPTAHAESSIAYYDGKNLPLHVFSGSVHGTVVYPRGEQDFGWGKIFVPDGCLETFAEMGPEKKDQISMRAIAFKKLKIYLEENGR